MSKKKKGSAEFRYYEVPREEAVLALMGNKGYRSMVRISITCIFTI